MTEDVVVKVDQVSKDFVLPHEKTQSIKSLFTGLTKGVDRKKEIQHALRDISFEIKKGEFFGIVGRNGSGKSTLLKILAGIYQPNKGTVKTSGKLVPFIELGVGFTPDLTGRENVYLNGAMLGFSVKEIDDMYDDIVSFAELEKFMDQKLKNYSSGMQVRLAFSLATRAKADILIVDEVLAVGDADFQRKCFEYFKRLKKDKVTVVFVSHDMEAVREYCDRAMIIESSHMLSIGNTQKIASQYMQLFAGNDPDKVAKYSQAGQDRWGDGLAKTVKLEVKIKPDKLIITQLIKASGSLEHPVAGFRIRNGAGKDVTGTNTKKQDTILPDLESGKIITIVWSMPNIFSDGQYTIDPSVMHYDEIKASDWWNDAVTFTVHRDRHLPYDIDPDFKLDVKVD